MALQANKERNRLVINDIRSIHPKPSQKIDFWIDDGLLIGVDKSRGRHLLSTTDRSNSGRGERQEASGVILFNGVVKRHPIPDALQPFSNSRSSFPALKCGTYFPGTETFSPVFGFRPMRGGR